MRIRNTADNKHRYGYAEKCVNQGLKTVYGNFGKRKHFVIAFPSSSVSDPYGSGVFGRSGSGLI